MELSFDVCFVFRRRATSVATCVSALQGTPASGATAPVRLADQAFAAPVVVLTPQTAISAPAPSLSLAKSKDN